MIDLVLATKRDVYRLRRDFVLVRPYEYRS